MSLDQFFESIAVNEKEAKKFQEYIKVLEDNGIYTLDHLKTMGKQDMRDVGISIGVTCRIHSKLKE